MLNAIVFLLQTPGAGLRPYLNVSAVRTAIAALLICCWLLSQTPLAFAERFNKSEALNVSIRVQQSQIVELQAGAVIKQELKGGESHSYRVQVESRQYLRVVIDQQGIDVMVRLFNPGGRKIAEVDSPNGTQGPEPVSMIAEESGAYRLEVSALDDKAPFGSYQISVEELREATAEDRGRVAAERTLAEATLLRNEGTGESLRRAIAKYEEALPLTRAAQDSRGEADTLTSIGVVYWTLGENQKALDYYGQALPLWRALGDRKEEAVTIHNFGTAYYQSMECIKTLGVAI